MKPMKPEAIVYTSKTGYTARYAAMLGEALGLPVCALEEKRALETPVIFLGWLKAGAIVGLKKALRGYPVAAVCAVGLGAVPELKEQLRKRTGLPERIAVFTLQGGMDHSKLQGMDRRMIQMLIKMLSKKKNPTQEEQAMLALIRNGGDFVCRENLAEVLAWYGTWK